MNRFSLHAQLQHKKLTFLLASIGDIPSSLKNVLVHLQDGQWNKATFEVLITEGLSEDVPERVYEVLVCLIIETCDTDIIAPVLQAIAKAASPTMIKILLKYLQRSNYKTDKWNLQGRIILWTQSAVQDIRCRANAALHHLGYLVPTLHEQLATQITTGYEHDFIEAIRTAAYAGEGLPMDFLASTFAQEEFTRKYPASLALAHSSTEAIYNLAVFEQLRDYLVHLFINYPFSREIYDDFCWMNEPLRQAVIQRLASHSNMSIYYHEFILDQLKPTLTEFEQRINRTTQLSTQDIEINKLEDLTMLGLSVNQIINLTEYRPKTLTEAKTICPNVKLLAEGHTAQIYCISNGAVQFAVKVRKRTILRNLESKFGFYNEIHARESIPGTAFPTLPITYYACTRIGLIVSNWVDGNHVHPVDHPLTLKMIEDSLGFLMALELRGFFEWDLSRENLLFDKENNIPHLVDVGMMNRFNPRKEYNPNGLQEPVYSAITVLKDNFLMPYLSTLNAIDHQAAFQLYCDYLKATPVLLMKKIEGLKAIAADQALIDYAYLRYNDVAALNSGCKDIGKAFLEKQFILDQYYSNHLRIHTILMTKHFTEEYFLLCAAQIELINTQYDLLKASGRLVLSEKTMDKAALVKKHQDFRDFALTIYQ